jgi:hypothetical protein
MPSLFSGYRSNSILDWQHYQIRIKSPLHFHSITSSARSRKSRGIISPSAFAVLRAPRNTPVEVVDKLNKEINAGLVDPKIAARLADMGATAFTGSPAELDKIIVEQTEKWGKVIRTANIKPE